MKKNLTQFKILHSNDIHADFFSNDKSAAGLLELDAAVKHFRDKNTLYFISGDILNGSIVDKEYKGISTFNLLNNVSPDLMCIGNHEFDYGSTWPLLLEKVADFPLICANTYIKGTKKRLFKPYRIFHINGLQIAIIGLLTATTTSKLKQQKVDNFIEVKKEYHLEVQKILNELKHLDLDLTICLTHLGYKDDIQLAKNLHPNNGVDIIIGGHSHTYLSEPTLVNGILITQAGVGADQLGYFELEIDTETNSIHNYKWSLISTKSYASSNTKLKGLLSNYKKEIEDKYKQVITILPENLEHLDRTKETSASKFISDLFVSNKEKYIAFVHGGFTRQTYINKTITLQTIQESWPFNDSLVSIEVKGDILEDFLKINTQNLHTQNFCCPSSNVKIDIMQSSINITLNHKKIDQSKNYFLLFSAYILDEMTKKNFLDGEKIISTQIISHDTNEFILQNISSSVNYCLNDRITYFNEKRI